MFELKNTKGFISTLAELKNEIEGGHDFFERMTRERAGRMKSIIDKRYTGLRACDYRRIYFLALWHLNLIPVHPLTADFYTIHDCSNVRPETHPQHKKVLSSVHKFYLQVREMTNEYVHPKRKPASVAELLSALRAKAPGDLQWLLGLARVSADAELLNLA